MLADSRVPAFKWFESAAAALDLTGNRMAQTAIEKRFLSLRAVPNTKLIWFSIDANRPE